MQKFINDLVMIGLSENEAKVYFLLLEKPLTATHIARNIQVHRSNIYGIISSLIQKGFLREINAKTKKLVAVNPSIAFNSSKTTLRMRIKLMEKLEKELLPHFKAEKLNDSKELIKILHSRSSILNTLEKLELEAKEEVLAFSKPPYIMNVEDLDTLNPAQRSSAKKGIIYKAVHEIEPDNLDNFLRRMEYFKSLGEEVRLAEHLPMKLFIFDGEIAVFTLENKVSNMSNFTFTSFEHSDVAGTFLQIFKIYWEKAIPLDEYKKKIHKERL
jgi:sugar-specific transcriptional regulator TrmB